MRSVAIIIEALFWIVAAAVLFGGATLVIGFLTAPSLGYAAGIAILVLLPMIVQTIKHVRRRRAAAILSYLEQAVRLNLPLPRMIYAAQLGEDSLEAIPLAMVEAGKVARPADPLTAVALVRPSQASRETAGRHFDLDAVVFQGCGNGQAVRDD